ncbi:bifunctional lysylphosphatidylglycerol flippase/synthetase MprF [Lactococcus ileimucosae]|uniref:bifunctional lysylphosphatidylglycerol flippase/synthetase MprF n=1 Tax=Lactococcus ileimucosae TaxID=2941329 RepID=UPI002044240D|nr:DUF2156 domain-containing protein [Lactococcus ileimucosae]
MYRLRIFAQNLAIFLSLVIDVGAISAFYLHRFPALREYFPSYRFMPHYILGFALGLLGLLVSFNLYRRVRSAWIITIIVQFVILRLNFISTQNFFSLGSIISLIILLILGLTHRDFSRTIDHNYARKAVFLGFIPLALALFNTLLSLSFLRRDYLGNTDVYLIFKQSLHFLLTMDVRQAHFNSHVHGFYIVGLIILTWICVVLALYYLLKPLVYYPILSGREKEKAIALVEKYGQNPMAYMTIDGQKSYFFSVTVEGMLAYTVVNNVLVGCGDIVCAPKDAMRFMGELVHFSRRNGWKILFMDITEAMRSAYESYGFSMIKIGEDACLRLEDFELKGKKTAKVRANINHARRLGITVSEYKPNEKRDVKIEEELRQVSEEWFGSKGPELGFMLGGLALENPLGRRYFYSRDEAGKMLAFVIFVPYAEGEETGYMADVTRRRTHVPNGSMELCLLQAFETMREEGVTWGNLGLCPLANIEDEEDSSKVTTQLFQFIYENMNGVYGFKGLYQAKKKWNPSDWQTRYIAYAPKPFGFSYAYAMLKAQNPKGINKLIIDKLKNKIEK